MTSIRWQQALAALGPELAETMRVIQRRKAIQRRQEAVAARRREMIALLRDNPSLTARELAERFDVGVRTAERDRRAMRELVARSGRPCPLCGTLIPAKP
jgi:predicted HTH transcriptional regulator